MRFIFASLCIVLALSSVTANDRGTVQIGDKVFVINDTPRGALALVSSPAKFKDFIFAIFQDNDYNSDQSLSLPELLVTIRAIGDTFKITILNTDFILVQFSKIDLRTDKGDGYSPAKVCQITASVLNAALNADGVTLK